MLAGKSRRAKRLRWPACTHRGCTVLGPADSSGVPTSLCKDPIARRHSLRPLASYPKPAGEAQPPELTSSRLETMGDGRARVALQELLAPARKEYQHGR